MTNQYILEKAIEITKEYARSGGPVSADFVLEKVYKKLQELAKEL